MNFGSFFSSISFTCAFGLVRPAQANEINGHCRLGAVKPVSRAIYTNTAPNGAFRACNGVYNTFALEQHTDEIAARLGMNCLEFRRRNVLGNGDLGATGQVFEGDVLGPMLDKMAAIRASRPSRRPAAGDRLYGRATAVGTWFMFVGPSAAAINLNADGSAALVTSGVEIDSGTMVQAVPQIVAAELGLRPDNVIVRQADTDAAGYDVGVGGGRATVSLGAASRAATIEVRGKLLKGKRPLDRTWGSGVRRERSSVCVSFLSRRGMDRCARFSPGEGAAPDGRQLRGCGRACAG